MKTEIGFKKRKETNKQKGCSKNCERAFPLLTNTLGAIEIIKGEATQALIDSKASLSVLKHTQLSCLLHQSKDSAQMAGTSNQSKFVFKPEPASFN